MFIDPLYLILVLLPGMVIALWAQAKVKRAYAKASKIPAQCGRTGAQAAFEILQRAGIDDVDIEPAQGWLSDHYDPRHRVLRLSPDVYGGRSLASLGIAAHEAGHALQHAEAYTPLSLRNGLVPMAAIGSSLSYILLFVGLFLTYGGSTFGKPLMVLGVALFSLTVIFQFVNLPCEFNASSRARQHLTTLGLVSSSEDAAVKKVLSAAAMTYVAAVITSLLTLLYFLLRSGLLGGDD